MCGILGLCSVEKVQLESFIDRLGRVNHRGHEAMGMAASSQNEAMGTAASSQNETHAVRCLGYVRDICYQPAFLAFANTISTLDTWSMIGHTRYSTVGGNDILLAQPLTMYHKGFGKFHIVHNGQIPNHAALRRQLENEGHRFQTTSDTEVLAAMIAHSEACTLGEAVAEVVKQVPGIFSFLALNNNQLVAARDRLGNRPLCWTQANETEIVFASEVGALPPSNYEPHHVQPGSIIVVERQDTSLRIKERSIVDSTWAECSFEWIYFARPDHCQNKYVVSTIRREFGQRLAQAYPVINADLVCGVPDSGLDAADGFSRASGIPLELRALVRNKYVVDGRSFILPGQGARQHAAVRKYAITVPLVKGKSVVIVDDTIVRSTTAHYLTKQLKEAGASEIHWRISAPPVRHSCHYGIDIPHDGELPASTRSEEEMCELIGADSVNYLPLADMMAVLNRVHPGWCTACFNGNYPIPVSCIPSFTSRDLVTIRS